MCSVKCLLTFLSKTSYYNRNILLRVFFFLSHKSGNKKIMRAEQRQTNSLRSIGCTGWHSCSEMQGQKKMQRLRVQVGIWPKKCSSLQIPNLELMWAHMTTSCPCRIVFHDFIPKSVELCLSCLTSSEPSTPSFDIKHCPSEKKSKSLGAQRAWEISIHLLTLSQGHFRPVAGFGMLSF